MSTPTTRQRKSLRSSCVINYYEYLCGVFAKDNVLAIGLCAFFMFTKKIATNIRGYRIPTGCYTNPCAVFVFGETGGDSLLYFINS